ncbi:MAG TPA: hypothetical protein DCP11_02190 [Microbacteriaceae bacterium]|jgi:type I restriction enzyme S subunit|nr:hypothetical protein [Microbacteriaceae bacterium]
MNAPHFLLSDVTDAVESSGPDPDAHEFVFIDLASVDPSSKRVAAPKRMLVAGAPARARQRVRSGDVLVSTIRPHLNGVAFVPLPLEGAFASTGFSVLRPRPELVDDRYLFSWVQGPSFVAEMARLATGGSVPAVSDTLVRSMAIPLPPLEEQRRIASILDQADQLRHDRRDAIALLDELATAFLLDMVESAVEFGTVADLVESATYGTSAKAGHGGARGGRLPVIRGGNITREGGLDLDDLVAVDLEDAEADRFSVRDGDVLFFRTGNAESVARSAVLRGDLPVVFAAAVIRLRPLQSSSADFLAAFLDSAYGKSSLRGMGSINPKSLLSMPLPLPPIAEQTDFEGRLQDLRLARTNERLQLAKLDELYASLQFRAFNGRL